MRNFKIIIGAVFLILLTYTANAQSKLKLSYPIVDTNMTYIDQQFNLNEWNDCSVRVLATLFTGRRYYIAHELLNRYGRESRQGVKASLLDSLIRQEYTDRYIGVIDWSGSLRKFVKKRSKDDESYVIITKDHAYVLMRTGSVWRMFGNPDDSEKEVVAIIKVKR